MAYTVASGDYLGKIAIANGMTLAQLKELNPHLFDAAHKGGNLIHPGEVVNTTPEEAAGAAPAEDTATTTAPANAPVDAGGGVQVKAGAPAAEKANDVGVGTGSADPETQLTILTGENMRWYLDKTTGKWYVSYGFGTRNRAVFFEASPENMDSLFGTGMRPTQYSTTQTFGSLSALNNFTFGGNVSEMSGKGTFENEVKRVQSIALAEGELPAWAREGAEGNADVMDWLYVSVAEDKSMDWLVEKLVTLPAFKNRFPGLDALKKAGNLTTTDAVNAFIEYETTLKRAVAATTNGDSSSVTPAVVGGLLTTGHSVQAATQAVVTFDRMEKFAPALNAFNSILVQQGLDPISGLQGMFDFVAGNAETKVYDIWEASSVAEAAAQAGLGKFFTADDAMSIALASNQNLESATSAAKKAAELLLRLRHEVDVSKFGLNHEDLIDMSFGVAPRSGVPESQLMDSINRAVQAAQADIQGKRATPYKGYTSTGTLQTSSLGNLRTQS
jgi:hypothetical protein